MGRCLLPHSTGINSLICVSRNQETCSGTLTEVPCKESALIPVVPSSSRFLAFAFGDTQHSNGRWDQALLAVPALAVCPVCSTTLLVELFCWQHQGAAEHEHLSGEYYTCIITEAVLAARTHAPLQAGTALVPSAYCGLLCCRTPVVMHGHSPPVLRARRPSSSS